MPHIIQLDRHVADLIAAGEVVERPASAVKELVENAVDAGATQITVEVQNGGMTFLRVTDNGCGIAPEDAPTAFLRHATSKIRTKEDLAAIGTLGFRGEALAAISSVSRIDLLTKTAEAEGVSLHLEGGVVTSQQPAGCPQGTTILVRDLFFNTPARMKFMKSDSAESSAIAAVVQQQALAHPEISFRLIRDGETQLQTSGDGERLAAIYTVFGRELAKNMLAVNGTWEKFHVTGYITKPTATRGNRALQYFFLNGRFIRSRLLSAALEEAYRNQMMTGRFPACVLELQMPLEAVDVNVHPAKTEVKFLNERAVFDAVHYAALSTLSNASGRVAMQMPKSPALDAQPAAPQQAVKPMERPAARPAVNPNFYQTMQAGEYRRQAGAQPRTVLASQVQYPTRTPKPVEPAMPPVEKAPSPIAPPQPEPVVAPVKPAAKAEPEPAAIPKEPIPTPAEPEQLALDLPEQTFIKRKVQLGKKEKDLYTQIKRSSYAELSNGDKITATTVLTRLLRLQQLAGGFLVTDDSDKPELVNTAKLDALQDIIEDYVLGAGKKLVIFARFIPEVTAIMKMIDKTFQKTGKKQVAIYGAIKKEDRGPIIKQFQEDPDTVIIVGQIDTLGVGVTLTAADTCVYYSKNFNYATYEQSLSRIHRIGQRNTCTYIDLETEGTVDEMIGKALARKEDMAKTVVDDWRAYFE